MSIMSLPRMAAGVACVLMLATIPAFAEDQDDSSSADGHKRGPGHREVNPEVRKALADACADMSEGNDCKIEFDEHTLEGTCTKSERTDALFCRPDMHRAMRAGVEACRDKNDGDDCSIERRDGDGTIDGKCGHPHFRRGEQRGEGGNDHRADGDNGDRGDRPLICMPAHDGN